MRSGKDFQILCQTNGGVVAFSSNGFRMKAAILVSLFSLVYEIAKFKIGFPQSAFYNGLPSRGSHPKVQKNCVEESRKIIIYRETIKGNSYFALPHSCLPYILVHLSLGTFNPINLNSLIS